MIRSAQWSRYAKYPFLRQHYAGWEVLYLRRINGWELGTNDCLLAIFSTETSVGWIMEDDTTRPLPGSQPLWNFSQFVGKMTIFTCLLSTPCLLLTSAMARLQGFMRMAFVLLIWRTTPLYLISHHPLSPVCPERAAGIDHIQILGFNVDLGSFWLQICCFLWVTGAESTFCGKHLLSFR